MCFQDRTPPSRAQQLSAATAVLATPIDPRSPTERAGLREGDVILALDGLPVQGVDDLHKLLTDGRIGARCPLTLLRRSEKMDVEVISEEMEGKG